MTKKISIIGAGKVGSTTAHILALKGLAEDIVLINRTEGIAKGIALDIMESMPVEGRNVRVYGSSNYSLISGSDIVVITAGAQRKEGMSREDLLKINSNIVTEISNEIKKYAPESIIIIVTNPLDAMAYLVKKVTGFERNRVIGMAGVLDSSRLRSFMAEELKADVNDINALVLGSHGDSMVAAVSHTTFNGTPISKMIGNERLGKLIARTKDAGAEIIKLEGSSAFYAPASSVVSMIDSILNDKMKMMPCSVYVEGEYGLKDIFIGLPVALGKNGAAIAEQLSLDESEKEELILSSEKISKSIKELDI